jgi:hypothetical protein
MLLLNTANIPPGLLTKWIKTWSKNHHFKGFDPLIGFCSAVYVYIIEHRIGGTYLYFMQHFLNTVTQATETPLIFQPLS